MRDWTEVAGLIEEHTTLAAELRVESIEAWHDDNHFVWEALADQADLHERTAAVLTSFMRRSWVSA